MSIRSSAVVLAGGRSRRMGRPKAALPFGNTTILTHLISELEVAFDDIVVVGTPRGHQPYDLEALLRPYSTRVRLVRDSTLFAGPAPALISGLRAARYPVAFACSCDLALLRSSVARAMTGMLDGFDAVIPVINGLEQPLCAVYRRACADTLETFLNDGEHRLTTVVQQLRTRRLAESELRQFDPQLHSFLNVNTPEEYALAVKIAALDRTRPRA
jgi:molybdopterin-guanine dinucleotide biosynthesis protein A